MGHLPTSRPAMWSRWRSPASARCATPSSPTREEDEARVCRRERLADGLVVPTGCPYGRERKVMSAAEGVPAVRSSLLPFRNGAGTPSLLGIAPGRGGLGSVLIDGPVRQRKARRHI